MLLCGLLRQTRAIAAVGSTATAAAVLRRPFAMTPNIALAAGRSSIHTTSTACTGGGTGLQRSAARMARQLLARQLGAATAAAIKPTTTRNSSSNSDDDDSDGSDGSDRSDGNDSSDGRGSGSGGGRRAGGGDDRETVTHPPDALSVRFGSQTANFRVVEPYAIRDLKLDAAEHFGLPVNRVLLHDGSGNIWPSSLTASAIRSTGFPIYIKLARTQPAPDIADVMAVAEAAEAAAAKTATAAAAGLDAVTPLKRLVQPNMLQHTRPLTPPPPREPAADSKASEQTETKTRKQKRTQKVGDQTSQTGQTGQTDKTDRTAEDGEEDVEDVNIDSMYEADPNDTPETRAMKELKHKFQLRLKTLLRSIDARRLLVQTFAIDRKSQGAYMNGFVTGIKIRAHPDGEGMTRGLVERVISSSNLKVMEIVLPAFAHYCRQKEMIGANGQLLDESVRWAANLTQPHEWYPLARSLKRKVIVHVGPTNSGKTYHALKRMRESESGVYCGPLRLLAWEVHEKLLKQGCKCSLLTGQEQVAIDGSRHLSSTIEMLDLKTVVDVAVIDEMQMIGNAQRGDAWTRAFLGVPAREVHVCGDPSMVPIIEEMCSLTGEQVEIKTYKRLTPLKLSGALNSWKKIQKY